MSSTNPYYVDESCPWFGKEAGWPEEVPKNIDFPQITLGTVVTGNSTEISR